LLTLNDIGRHECSDNFVQFSPTHSLIVVTFANCSPQMPLVTPTKATS
jgi:hypothetical protein